MTTLSQSKNESSLLKILIQGHQNVLELQLPELLDKMKELCISLLLDPSYQNELSSTDIPVDYNLPNS